MKVILLKNFNSLGRRGEVKDVAEGYARNYLLPQKIALPATEGNCRKYSAAVLADKALKKISGLTPEELAGRLKNIVLKFQEKVDDKGTFFAGLTKEKLIRALSEKGLALKAKQLELEQPIKKMGEYKVSVAIASGLKSEFKVVAEKKE